MYFIINITKPAREITISDLNISLGPNKALDLEKIRKRSEIEDSKDLKKAIKARIIEARHISKREENKKDNIPVSQPSNGISDSDIEKIRTVLKQEIQSQISQSQPQAPVIPQDLVDALKKISESQNVQPQNDPTYIQQNNTVFQETEQNDYQLDDEKLASIHAKTVKAKMKETEGNIEYEEKVVKDSVSERLKKLNEMLG